MDRLTKVEVDVSVVSVSICAMIFQLNTGVCMISIYFKFQVIIFIHSKVMLILVVSNMYKKGDSFQMTFLFISTAEQNFFKSKKPLTFHRVISLSPRNR